MEQKAIWLLPTQEQTFRHEWKHVINYCDYLILRNRLQVIAKQDYHVREDGTYQIRSLYFDNLDDKVLLEKLNGYNRREKFRIRYYNGDTSFIRLEKKSKINGLCSKVSASITSEQCERLLNNDTLWMKVSDNPLFVELYAKMMYQQLRPKVLVDYVREPYIYEAGNVRVTIDTQIKTGLYNQNLFDTESISVEVPDNQIILEVKYDSFLPEVIQNAVRLNDRRGTSYSKYAACRMYG
ncbi:polyphosphate polymerase domain-containing protein [Velocimicrobium porci]|uniref:Polyphosphate polymerase domain-containing protein n=1 Tax=Velocimicrobium porci TaxID=2606634 RepID=A0A6L5Y064_9FIRM|nr:polyphosphate polymerase domain-containing protein [Velocimicrobium porci]MSS63583.1 polyphosphate polymerase domain-containing protein [Velocimicrobium porci]